MNHKLLIIVIILIIAGGIVLYTRSTPPIEVAAYRLSEGEVLTSVTNTRVGTVKACRRAYLAPATGGQVAALHVKESDKVKQGQLLLEVWNQD